ncbi:MAG: FtsW/RodA/SpoVE family cell cycle protein [Candidatus Paceibacterota bacterium]|jgi:rod shape determining protein RodA
MMLSDVSGRGLRKSKMDWVLLGAVAALLTIGTLAILSATVALPAYAHILKTHFIALPLAGVFFLLGWSLNYQIYQDQWKFLYALVILALGAVLFLGVTDRGSRAWFHLPFFSVQPSELCRVGLILVFANFLDRNSNRVHEPAMLIKGLALTLPFFYLLMKQPDFSGVALSFPVIIGMLYCCGARLFHLLVLLGFGFLAGFLPVMWTMLSLHPDWIEASDALQLVYSLREFGLPALGFCAAVAAGTWFFYWLSKQFRAYLPPIYFVGGALVVILGFLTAVWAQGQMKEYQRKRFEVFLMPDADPKGAGYNLLQAQIGMGSGGFFGKGVFSGTQSRLGFVPERHTDFVLAVVGEEMGFLGTAGVLLLYLLMLMRIFGAADSAQGQYGYLVCCGIGTMFLVYMMINFGMLVGVIPVAGIPLPLVSYGGSNVVASLWALGIAESVYARRMALV